MATPTADALTRENDRLRRRLEEAEETIRAIRGGEVDAVVIQAGADQVYTLESPDRPYRLLVEQMPQGAATLTAAGVVLYCNRHFAELLGRPAEALRGRPVHEFVTPAGRPLFEALLRDAGVGACQGEVAFERDDATAVPAYLGVKALREGVAGLCLVVTDLTHQKHHEAIVAAESLARSILEQAADAIVVCDATGQVIRASQGAHRLCGDNPLLRPFEAAFPLQPATAAADAGPPAALALGPVLAGLTVAGLEVRLACRDGRRRHLLFSAAPLRDAGGAAAGAVGTLTDITARRRAEEALRQAHAELERRVEERTAELREAQRKAVQAERLAAIGQMVAGLAHESRNALQRSQACLSVLGLRLHGRAEELDLLDRVQRAQDDLHRLYEEVREYAAPLRLERRVCRPAELWRAAWEDLRPLHEAKGAELREGPDGGRWECPADPFHLKQVFRNLLENALAAAPAPARVEIACAPADLSGREAVRITIRDNGPGFDPEQRARLFEPFFTTKVRGTGLGLAICKRVVEAHGGRIEAGSADGPGAELVLTLPRSDA